MNPLCKNLRFFSRVNLKRIRYVIGVYWKITLLKSWTGSYYFLNENLMFSVAGKNRPGLRFGQLKKNKNKTKNKTKQNKKKQKKNELG